MLWVRVLFRSWWRERWCLASWVRCTWRACEMEDLLMIPPGLLIRSAGRYGVGSAARYELVRGAKSFACESQWARWPCADAHRAFVLRIKPPLASRPFGLQSLVLTASFGHADGIACRHGGTPRRCRRRRVLVAPRATTWRESFACESRRSLRGVLGGTCSARVNRSVRRPLRGRRISLRSTVPAAVDPCSTACRKVPVRKRGGGLPRLRPVIRRIR